MPFLRELKETHPKVADKIQRDSLNTRGASWGVKKDGEQNRRNRQPRWTLVPGDQFYPTHWAEYSTCLDVARHLTSHVYAMKGAPTPSETTKALLKPGEHDGLCPICLVRLDFDDFSKAKQSKAEIETAHIDPQAVHIHTDDNVAFAHRQCNIAQGDRSIEEFLAWIGSILERHAED